MTIINFVYYLEQSRNICIVNGSIYPNHPFGYRHPPAQTNSSLPGPFSRTGQDEIGDHPPPGQPLPHYGRISLSPFVEGTINIGQRWIVPARLGMSAEEQLLHDRPGNRFMGQ